MGNSRPRRLGKYDLLARIAKGGMAEIYLARQRGMVGFSRLVVVKRILPHLAEESQFVQMFMEEARLAAQINHPNVVQIHDVGQFEGSYYIAMEFIDGPSLGVICRRARRRRGPVPYAVAASIIAQACDGLHAAHELTDEQGQPRDLVHRDVSPHNLMLTGPGLVKLVDFGIAKAQDTAVKTHTGKIKGKYPYMSPEQCRGDPLDRRTDIFSLGIVFHELLVARRLFQRSTDLMILKAITEEEVPDPGELAPDVPGGISRVVLRSMQRFPDQRYATAAQMGQDLREVMRELGQEVSQQVVARYLETELPDLLEQRRAAINSVLELRPSREGPPLVEGLDEARGGSSDLATPETLDVLAHAERRRGGVPRWALVVAAVVIVAAAGGGLAYRLLGGVSGPPLRFGLPPSFPAEVGQKEMQPFLRYLERHLDRPVQLVVARDYRSLRCGLLRGRIHFANLPPLQFVKARHQAPGLDVVVTQIYEGARTYQAYLIVPVDSAITSVEGLRGRRFCYVDPGSTSGYLLPRQYMRARGIDPDRELGKTRFSGNHLQVIKDVAGGVCDAGAVYSGAMLSARAHGVASSRVRMLAMAGQLPYDVICVSPRASRRVSRRLRSALLRMDPERDLGRKVVSSTFRITKFEEPDLSSFEDVERAAAAEGLLKQGVSHER